MRPEDLRAVLAVPEPGELVARVTRQRQNPAHRPLSVRVVLVVARRGREDRHSRHVGKECDALRIEPSRKQNQRAYLRMSASELDGMIYAAAAARGADARLVYAG